MIKRTFKLINKLFQRKIFRFATIGLIGFVVDYLTLQFFYLIIGFPIMFSRTLSFLFAVLSNWLLNRKWTFSSHQETNLKKQYSKFLMASAVAAIPNLVIFKILIMWLPQGQLSILLALVAGILVGFVVNFLLSLKWVFV